MILSASHVGFPLSTTHVMSGAIMGAGAAKRLSAVRWGVAGNIVAGLGADAAVLGRRGCADLRRGAASSATARPGRSWSSGVLLVALLAFFARAAAAAPSPRRAA